MKLNIRTFLLKSLPYLMSIAGGVVLYTDAIDNAPTENLRDLIINVSASLLSIPLVFLLYDYTNSRITRQMKRHMANTIGDQLNTLILNLIMVLRDSMSVRSKLTVENLNRMLTWRVSEISTRLKIDANIMNQLRAYHNDLDTLLYRNGQTDVLTSDQLENLTALARDMTHLMNENKFHKNRRISAKYVENIMTHILDWLDSDSVAALKLSKHLSDTPASQK
ncbi:MAG: hypothetical protein J6R22_00470 [Alphaproteobacteria bacterium]|nr:hypothetical protein [Alphaproteobacteria bacterium]